MWECVGRSLPAGGLIEGPCHLLSLVSVHRLLSPLLFSFGPWLPSQAAQENSKFFFLFYAEQFGSHIVLLSPSKPGPFTLRGHRDVFLNKEPAYVHWRMESFLDWAAAVVCWCSVYRAQHCSAAVGNSRDSQHSSVQQIRMVTWPLFGLLKQF